MSCKGVSGSLVSEQVRLRFRLLDRLMGRPRSITDDSDMFLPCDDDWATKGSRFSILGDPRRSAADGDPALNGFEMAERGVGSGWFTFGDRLESSELLDGFPVDVKTFVRSCVLLDLVVSLRGLGDALRSVAGDLGGTSGGFLSLLLLLLLLLLLILGAVLVSRVKVGFWLTPGLRMGESGFPKELGASNLEEAIEGSADSGVFWPDDDGPVTQAIRASPKGLLLQFVPGALLDLS